MVGKVRIRIITFQMVIAVKLEFLYKEIVTRREYNERKYKILSNKNILV